MTAAIVIPARYGSTRFPGKPLLRETGKYLIQYVVEQAQKARHAQRIIVATDDQRISDAVASFGGTAVLTSATHQTGTDRIAEVLSKPEYADIDLVVNVQGDEPEIEPELIDALIKVTQTPDVAMATVAAPFEKPEDLANPNMVKVVVDQRGFALYFSRSIIPHDRDKTVSPASISSIYRKHLGIYAYKRTTLLTLSRTPPCDLEKFEKLEQLRALYLGMRINVIHTPRAPHGIDTPEDYKAFLQRIKR